MLAFASDTSELRIDMSATTLIDQADVERRRTVPRSATLRERDWPLKRLRFVCDLNPVKSAVSHLSDTEVSFLPMEAIGEDGTLRFDETRTIAQVLDGYTYFRDDDVVVAKITPCFENGKGALCSGLTNGIGFGTTELHVLRSGGDVLPAFVQYITRSYPFRMLGEASMHGAAGQKRVPERFLKDYVVGVPPLPEQRAIAAFLDRETTTIDALIAKKERLIELLREKRAAVISHSVTRGLDPDAPMKDSGVEWLGWMPEHWETVQLKRRWLVIDCKHRTATYVVDGIPIVSTTEVKPGRLVLEGSRQTTETDYLDLTEGGRLPRRGDIIYSRNASVGSAAYVATDERFCMGQDVCLIRSARQDQLFLSYLLDSDPVREQLESLLVGSTIKRVNVEQIRQFWITCPPVNEQRDIAAYLDSRTNEIDALTAKVRQHIEKLRERRTALISAAVTGQIDVRGEVEVG